MSENLTRAEESRREVLFEKAAEVRAEWIRAERAEAELARLRALVEEIAASIREKGERAGLSPFETDWLRRASEESGEMSEQVDDNEAITCMDCGRPVDSSEYDWRTGDSWGYCKRCDAWTCVESEAP